jgi:hypothetical protein
MLIDRETDLVVAINWREKTSLLAKAKRLGALPVGLARLGIDLG